MKGAIWIVAIAAGLALVGCGGDGSSASTTSTTPSSTADSAPTAFAGYVDQQVTTQPAFGTSVPAPTGSLTSDLELDNASAFTSVSFGTGDALPAATYQGAVACTQAGNTGCNPTVSADPNSSLN